MEQGSESVVFCPFHVAKFLVSESHLNYGQETFKRLYSCPANSKERLCLSTKRFLRLPCVEADLMFCIHYQAIMPSMSTLFAMDATYLSKGRGNIYLLSGLHPARVHLLTFMLHFLTLLISCSLRFCPGCGCDLCSSGIHDRSF